MLMRVFKYPVPLNDRGVVHVEMPTAAKVLCLQMQRDVPCIWAMVEEGAVKATRTFKWVGTGHPLSKSLAEGYVGTLQMADGVLVFHLFEATGK